MLDSEMDVVVFRPATVVVSAVTEDVGTILAIIATRYQCFTSAGGKRANQTSSCNTCSTNSVVMWVM